MAHASGNKEIAVNVEFVENTTAKGYFIVFQHNTSGLPDTFRAVSQTKATTTLEDLPAGTYIPVFYDLERDGLPNVSPAYELNNTVTVDGTGEDFIAVYHTWDRFFQFPVFNHRFSLLLNISFP